MALGAAAVLFGPTILTVAGSLAKSLVKTGIKSGMLLYDKGKEVADEAKETIADLKAEAKAELSPPAPKAKSAK
jgi:hypothetical protein